MCHNFPFLQAQFLYKNNFFLNCDKMVQLTPLPQVIVTNVTIFLLTPSINLISV